MRSYLDKRPPVRDLGGNTLLSAFVDDCDWRGNALDVFWSTFTVEAKARGCMALIIDMPSELPADAGSQIEQRAFPYLESIPPERVAEYELDERGRVFYIAITDTMDVNGESADIWRCFDQDGWWIQEPGEGGEIAEMGEHGLGLCPVILFSESLDWPQEGVFSQIAYLSKRVYNMQSELDEILRAQTFSLLTYHVPLEHKDGIPIDQIASEIGTHNMLVHYGDRPEFIAPPDGPAKVYIERIEKTAERIRKIGLTVEEPDRQTASSGVTLTIRFQAINSALVKFADRLEDFERRMWDVVTTWLGIENRVTVAWSKDFSIADIGHEIEVAQNMQALGAPDSYHRAKLKHIASLDLQTSAPETLDDILRDIDESGAEITEPEMEPEDVAR